MYICEVNIYGMFISEVNIYVMNICEVNMCICVCSLYGSDIIVAKYRWTSRFDLTWIQQMYVWTTGRYGLICKSSVQIRYGITGVRAAGGVRIFGSGARWATQVKLAILQKVNLYPIKVNFLLEFTSTSSALVKYIIVERLSFNSIWIKLSFILQ